MSRRTRYVLSDWFHDLPGHWFLRWLGRLLAVLMLLAILFGGYQLVRDYQAEQAATNARLQ